jgi:hypothetical protein
MRDPELVARAGYAAARLEQAWERWRALHGLAGSSDPLASYVGYSLKEPMGQPRVVLGFDAAEAEYFADFLENHECAGLVPPESYLVSGPAQRAVNGSGPLPRDVTPEPLVRPRDVPSEPMARLADTAEPVAVTGPASAERAMMSGPGTALTPVARGYHQAPASPGGAQDPADPIAAELAGWASGELPGQASEHLASWTTAESAPSRTMDRPRTAR